VSTACLQMAQPYSEQVRLLGPCAGYELILFRKGHGQRDRHRHRHRRHARIKQDPCASSSSSISSSFIYSISSSSISSISPSYFSSSSFSSGNLSLRRQRARRRRPCPLRRRRVHLTRRGRQRLGPSQGVSRLLRCCRRIAIEGGVLGDPAGRQDGLLQRQRPSWRARPRRRAPFGATCVPQLPGSPQVS